METWGKQERKYGLIEKLFIANKRWPISVLRSFAVFESTINEVKLATIKKVFEVSVSGHQTRLIRSSSPSRTALSKHCQLDFCKSLNTLHLIYTFWRKVISLFKYWIFIMYIFVLLCKLIKLFVKVNWIKESSDCSCPDCINRRWETIQQYYSVWSIMARTVLRAGVRVSSTLFVGGGACLAKINFLQEWGYENQGHYWKKTFYRKENK